MNVRDGLPLETLSLNPSQSWHTLSGESDNTEPVLGVLGEDFFVVVRHYIVTKEGQRESDA